jgi:hypothetical protein
MHALPLLCPQISVDQLCHKLPPLLALSGDGEGIRTILLPTLTFIAILQGIAV